MKELDIIKNHERSMKDPPLDRPGISIYLLNRYLPPPSAYREPMPHSSGTEDVDMLMIH